MLTGKSRSRAVITLLCFAASGSVFLRIQQIKNAFQRDHAYLKKPLIVRGTLQQVQHNTQERGTTTILLKTDTIHHPEIGALFCPKLILIQIPCKRAQNLSPGQLITFQELTLDQPQVTPKIQDNPYALYLMKEGIWASAFVSSGRFCIHDKALPRWHHAIFNYLSNHFHNSTKHLYNPLFLGKKEKDKLSLQIQHQSLYWGIAHHMARSGIHLVTLVGLCVAIFHYVRIRSRFRYVLYALLIVGYAFISVPTISFTRSLIMIMIQMFSKLHGFQYSGIHAFALTTFIVVQYNPLHVLFLDFQLSFGITAVIIWLFYIKWAKTVAFPLTSLLRC